MKELEACPCCNGTNAVTFEQYKTVNGINETEHYNTICADCGLQIRRPTRKESRQAWNTRASGWVSVESITELINYHKQILHHCKSKDSKHESKIIIAALTQILPEPQK